MYFKLKQIHYLFSLLLKKNVTRTYMIFKWKYQNKNIKIILPNERRVGSTPTTAPSGNF